MTQREGKVGCPRPWRRRVFVWAVALCSLPLAVWLAATVAIYSVADARVAGPGDLDGLPSARAAVVMGCVKTLWHGGTNPYYLWRIEAAAALYKSGKVDCVIVSGDNHVEGYDEPSDMKASLVEAGVPADRIVCDYAGFRTLDSVVRAKKVFGLDSFIVVSQRDHARRAVFLARGFGCDAYGYAARDVTGRASVKTTVREQFAKVAALIDVIVRRGPRFLGKREPLPPPVRLSS